MIEFYFWNLMTILAGQYTITSMFLAVKHQLSRYRFQILLWILSLFSRKCCPLKQKGHTLSQLTTLGTVRLKAFKASSLISLLAWGILHISVTQNQNFYAQCILHTPKHNKMILLSCHMMRWIHYILSYSGQSGHNDATVIHRMALYNISLGNSS